MSTRVELHIEELVLHGVPARHRDRVGAALRAELERLFAESGVPTNLRHDAHVPEVKAPEIARSRGDSPERLGAETARAVYRGLGG